MLNNCFERYTRKLLSLLKPELMVLGGGDAVIFDSEIRKSFPDIKTERVLHFAHRKGKSEQDKDVTRIRALLAAARR